MPAAPDTHDTPDGHGSLNPAWARACETLSHVVIGEAEATARLVGFGWQGDPKAPADYNTLCGAYARSSFTGQPLPVSDRHCDSTIYTTIAANLSYRFWHDVTHVRLGFGFDLKGEMKVAESHLDVLRARGLGPSTPEYWLFHGDTLIQAVSGEVTGAFPEDQACFARSALELGLAPAIRNQLRARLLGDPQAGHEAGRPEAAG